jgi:hypothetical protein
MPCFGFDLPILSPTAQEFVSWGELYKLLKEDKVEMDWPLRIRIAKDTASGSPRRALVPFVSF